MIDTDIVVIGARPTGLFTVFEARLLGMRCHLVDSLTKPGGHAQKYIQTNQFMIYQLIQKLWLVN